MREEGEQNGHGRCGSLRRSVGGGGLPGSELSVARRETVRYPRKRSTKYVQTLGEFINLPYKLSVPNSLGLLQVLLRGMDSCAVGACSCCSTTGRI